MSAPSRENLRFMLIARDEFQWKLVCTLKSLEALCAPLLVDFEGDLPASPKGLRRAADTVLGRLSSLRSQEIWMYPVRSLELLSEAGQVLFRETAYRPPRA